ncbi:MAG: hypothetical protein IPG96_02315 [Proteobacteria bacterium]|nr:hypothetical protein [Pseudomonadota bacterium]
MLDPNADRRRHVVYVTRNTEYHCRGRECVGVRSRQTGAWLREHAALRGRLTSAAEGGAAAVERAPMGLRLIFLGREGVLTSPVEAVLRPAKEALVSYASRASAGSIRLPRAPVAA